MVIEVSKCLKKILVFLSQKYPKNMFVWFLGATPVKRITPPLFVQSAPIRGGNRSDYPPFLKGEIGGHVHQSRAIKVDPNGFFLRCRRRNLKKIHIIELP